MEGITTYDKTVIFVTTNDNEKDPNYQNFMEVINSPANKEKLKDVVIHINKVPGAKFLLTVLCGGSNPPIMLQEFSDKDFQTILDTIDAVKGKSKTPRASRGQAGGAVSFKTKYYKYKSKYNMLKKVITGFS